MADPSETTQVSEAGQIGTAELLDAVRDLAEQVGGLQAELQSLRSSTALPNEEREQHGWAEGAVARPESPPWVRALDSPEARRPPVPRLLLEILFLVAVAVLAAVAGLDTPVIVVLMAGAWVLVALAEWVAEREAATRQRALFESPLGSGLLGEDPSWFGPPPERELLDVAVVEEEPSEDTAAKLPPRLDA